MANSVSLEKYVLYHNRVKILETKFFVNKVTVCAVLELPV